MAGARGLNESARGPVRDFCEDGNYFLDSLKMGILWLEEEFLSPQEPVIQSGG